MMCSTGRSSGRTLTAQEIEAAHLARYDLGPGYPQIVIEDYVAELYRAEDLGAASIEVPPLWTTERQVMLDDELEAAVTSFLSLRDGRYQALRSTFSGSVALDRALAAVLTDSRRCGAQRLNVITTSPSIDIMRLFLQERADVLPLFVDSRRRGVVGEFDIGEILDQLAAPPKNGARKLVLITSPENPTGSVWSAVDLRAIADACADANACLLVDHSFLVAGVHEDCVPRIWDLAPPNCDWIATWDTGKTFGLNEDKLGFIIVGSARMVRAVDESVAVMQFGMARRQKLLFGRLLTEARRRDYVAGLRLVCRENLDCLKARLRGTPLSLSPPAAGSFALVDCARLGRSDEEVRSHLMNAGVGVVAANVFFHGAWRPQTYLRLALAREPQQFAEAVEAMLEAI